MMPASELDFIVPHGCEAVEPPEERGLPRDRVRLLVSNRSGGPSLHTRFDALPSLLRAGDLLVANDSATLPAALHARRANGAAVLLHVSSHVAQTLWIVEPRGAVGSGESLYLPGGVVATLLVPVSAATERLWYVRVATDRTFAGYLQEYGEPIRYAYVTRTFPLEAYQTIFARTPGSAEMPSAGRPFTSATLSELARRGVAIATITLHAGVSSPEAHEPPQPESYVVPSATAAAVNRARARGGRVIAIGTTVVRALESAVREGIVIVSSGRTELVVTKEQPPAAVDGLLTGLHEPRASHLALLEAFLGPEALVRSYDEASREGYLWHEFGDVHLIAT